MINKGHMRQLDGAAAPTLRDWLAGRSESERSTLQRLWALPKTTATAPDALADALLRPETVARTLAALRPPERAALERVQSYGGAVPAPVLEREFGDVRDHRDYPNPRAYLMALEQPPSPTERLYTLALIMPARDGPSRSYVIPSDLLSLLPPVQMRDRALRLPVAADPPSAFDGVQRDIERNLLSMIELAQSGRLEVTPSSGLNKASLVRLARYWGQQSDLKGLSREEHWPYVRFLRCVGIGAGLLRVGPDARLQAARAALEWMRRPAIERARALLDGWVESGWDELVSLLGLKIQRSYFRDLPRAKRTLLGLLTQVPPGQWVAFDAFTSAVKRAEPDFARPDGRYDLWSLLDFYRRPLDGFEHWDEVEGRQVPAIVGGALHWLGLTDLGMHDKRPISFRINPLGAALLSDAPDPPAAPDEPLLVQPNFEVIAPAHASLYARFQLGRIAERVSDDEAAIYRLTKRSVQSALENGITASDMLRFLDEQSAHAPPQNVVATLTEWAGQHGQIALRRGVLLESSDASILERVCHDKRVKLPEIERLTDATWLVREGDAPVLAERLRKAGYSLTGDDDPPQTPLKEHDLTVLLAALETYVHVCEALSIEGDASAALHRRVMRLLSEKQINRAYHMSREVVKALEARLGERT